MSSTGRKRARYDKWYAHGYRSPLRPASEALAVYQEIKDRTKMDDAAIMEAAGLGIRWLAKLKAGDHQQVQGEKFRRLVAFRDSNPAPVRVPAVGAQRRLAGLHRMGWTVKALRERLGFQADYIRHLEPVDLILTSLHQKIAALYDELSMIPGPSESARIRAEKAGKAPPLAWDDDTIDDPKAKPNLTGGYRQHPGYIDHAKVVRRLRGDKSIRLNKYEAIEAVRILRARGVTGYAQEHVYGLNPERYQ